MFDIDFLDIPPLSATQGTVRLPGSKSISNRVLLLAALSQGETIVHDLLASDDTAVMLTALKQLGCSVEQSGHTVVVGGLGGKLVTTKGRLFMGNAGTAMRPLTAALALLGGHFELSGVPRMHERPIEDLVQALRQLGCAIEYMEQDGFPPLRISPGVLKLDRPIRVRGNVSSQFLTALLMALPLVASQDICIEVEGDLISKPYIEITLNLLARFGIQAQRQGWTRFVIPAGSVYQSPGEIYVESDASSASYFIAMGAISASTSTSKNMEIWGLGLHSIQGDIRFVQAAELMGANIQSTSNSLTISRGVWPLKAIDLDCNHIPDAAMTLAMMALYADGPSTLRNIGSWRVKETDRIVAMARELRKLGAGVEEGADFIQITPPTQWKTAPIQTYDDHRMAMCFSLAAFNPAGLPVRILAPQCVAKTFPDYFEIFFSVVQALPASIPVICIDGPTASGKGTLAALTARKLGYHYLDSGALYRVTALAAKRAGVALENAQAVADKVATLRLRFEGNQVFLEDQDVSDAIRTESAGMAASQVSVHPQVRMALLQLQRSFRRIPGLVTDGRDMGTVIFPDAALKIFLTADAHHRAHRRFKQLISKGISANIEKIEKDLQARDQQDLSRQTAPLKPPHDAKQLDNSELSIEKSVAQVIEWWCGTQPI